MNDQQASNIPTTLRRREFGWASLCCLTASTLPSRVLAQDTFPNQRPFRLKYILASPMYGYAELSQILPEVSQTGSRAIDIWPKIHGNQREQVEEMGYVKFAKLLADHDVKLGAVTCYNKGPFELQSEIDLLKRVPTVDPILITGAKGPKNLSGAALKEAVRDFVRQMGDHVAAAKQGNCEIAIENHKGSLLSSVESMKWFAESCQEFGLNDGMGIAFAPHHLPQDPTLMANLIIELGSAIKFFYAQQHGLGSSEKLPKQQELLQLPGRGNLDFRPVIKALQSIEFTGYTEIFMHPVPRGAPILDTNSAITQAINESRDYLDRCAE